MTKQHEVRILLGVWGEKLIHDFLELSLASLLAPGNIPALCQEYKTTFVFLTKTYDIAVFENHPFFPLLKKHCDIQFLPINDLIMFGNYSATLTLAYDRAIRETGEAALNTYFIFLTSDYILADGSFKHLISHMKKGISGIQTGNFQVIQEEMEGYLLDKIDPKTHVMQIPPSELFAKSIKHLHPITATNLVNQSYAHNYQANRFFCKHHNILGARFYLLHMLCIKPETIEYQVGASCDYSFIPEMCPSGNIVTITDSDEYFVIEAQPKHHELNYVKWGAFNTKKLVKALADWTTVQHRKNSQETIFFHSGPMLESDKKMVNTQLENFIQPVNALLNQYHALPYRNHPYWLGAISTLEFHKNLSTTIDNNEFHDLRPLSYISKYRKFLHRIMGLPPTVRRWHFRWREFTSIQNHVKNFIGDHSKKLLALYHSNLIEFLHYSKWLKDHFGIQHQYDAKVLNRPTQLVEQLKAEKFERCIIPVRMEELKKLPELLNTLTNFLSAKAEIMIIITNENNHYQNYVYNIKNEFLYRIYNVISSSYKISNIHIIRDNFSFIGSLALERIQHHFNYNKKMRFLMYGLIGIPGSIFFGLGNLLSRKNKDKRFGHCAGLLITLTPTNNTEII